MTSSFGSTSFDADEDRIEHQHEVVAPRRSFIGLVISLIAVVGLGYLVVNGGQSGPDDNTSSASTTTPPSAPTTTPSTTSVGPIELGASETPEAPLTIPGVAGSLADGIGYRVEERLPGVLCVVFETPASSAGSAPDPPSDTCHHELVTASGPAVIDDSLVFGYLPPGAASAAIRYRSGNVGNDGIRVEQGAQFFALPVNGRDPYRIQYRAANLAVTDEIPLVGLVGGPSQPLTDAERDGVPAAIASLAFNRRVDPIQEWTYLSEGPYVWSRLAEQSIDDRWSEVLLLDDTGTRIVRSTPFPGVRLTARLDLDGAVYLLGQQITTPDQAAVDRGEVAFPVVVARIDRTTGTSLVRIFPRAADGAEPLAPEITRPGWLLGPALPEVDPDLIGATDRFLQIEVVSTDGDPTRPILLDRELLTPIADPAQ